WKKSKPWACAEEASATHASAAAAIAKASWPSPDLIRGLTGRSTGLDTNETGKPRNLNNSRTFIKAAAALAAATVRMSGPNPDHVRGTAITTPWPWPFEPKTRQPDVSTRRGAVQYGDGAAILRPT